MNNHFLFADTAFMDQPGEAAVMTRPAARVYPIHVAMSGSRALARRVAAASRSATPAGNSVVERSRRIAATPTALPALLRPALPRPAAHLLFMGLSSLVVLPAAVMALVVAMGPGLL